MDDAQWIWAAVALGSGLLFGEIAGRLLRMSLGRSDKRAWLREASGAIASFVFWASTATGLVVAIALIDTEVLEDLQSRLADRFPRFLVAFLLLMGGYAVSVAFAAMVGQSARKATGVRQRGLERLLQAMIMAAAVVLALTEAGVESSMLIVVLAIVVGAPSLAFALLSALGGREVASQIAAGRALRHQLRAGLSLRCGNCAGTIVALHATTVEIENADGASVHVPYNTMLSTSFTLEE